MPDNSPEDQALAPFESEIVAVQGGQLTITELLRDFMDVDIFLPSAAEAVSLQAIEPLLWPYEGANLVGVFTHPDRAVPFAEQAPHMAQMTGRKAVGMISETAGLLVNPGSEKFSFVISPVAAASMRREFGA